MRRVSLVVVITSIVAASGSNEFLSSALHGSELRGRRAISAPSPPASSTSSTDDQSTQQILTSAGVAFAICGAVVFVLWLFVHYTNKREQQAKPRPVTV
mmetsp:Transcript_10370/g.26713  ORF Transcript_10370/g.26713 Transcript_10370/m.26713 type:complete len:99 (-) Transcript_10370:48-344(-)